MFYVESDTNNVKRIVFINFNYKFENYLEKQEIGETNEIFLKFVKYQQMLVFIFGYKVLPDLVRYLKNFIKSNVVEQ